MKLTIVARAATFLLLAAMAGGVGAQTRDAPFRPPAPWKIEDTSYGDRPLLPRRGLVLHAVEYEWGTPQWATPDLADQAARECGAQLVLPSAPTEPGAEPEMAVVEHEVWLLFSGVEALELERYPVLTALDGCTAVVGHRSRKTRMLFSGDLVTKFSFADRDSPRVESIPAGEWRDSPFLPIADLAELRQRYGERVYRPESSSYPDKVVCIYTGNSLDRSTQCHLDEPGRWRGLLLSRHFEHTATAYSGVRVKQYWLDAWIDGDLFVWDAEIEAGDTE